MPRTSRKATIKRGRQVRWPIDPERFSRIRRAAHLSPTGCSNALGVSTRTIQNWENGRTAIPYTAYKLLRVLTGAKLPHPEWQGFWIQGSKLWTPEQKSYDAAELAYIANVIAMARFWLRDYHARSPTHQQALLSVRHLENDPDP